MDIQQVGKKSDYRAVFFHDKISQNELSKEKLHIFPMIFPLRPQYGDIHVTLMQTNSYRQDSAI